MRQVSPEGIRMIKRFEGLETQAYRDIAGVWTIGYGHAGADIRSGMTITEDEAEALLRRDLDRFEGAVANAVTVRVTQRQFDALVSLSYNIGIGAFARSTALRRLNAGDYHGAAAAMTWWNKASVGGRKREVRGLTRRRAIEAAAFSKDIPDAIVREERNPVGPAVPGPPPAPDLFGPLRKIAERLGGLRTCRR